MTVVATQVSWLHQAPARPLDLLVRVAGWAAVVVGGVAWWRGVRVRLAGGLLAFGVALFLRDFRESPSPLVHGVGLATAYAWTAIGAHLVLAWPDGVVRGRGLRVLVAAGYVCALGSQSMRVLDPNPAIGNLWPLAGSVSAGVLALALASVLGHRWWTRRRPDSPDEIVIVGVVLVALVAAWVAFLNFEYDTAAQVDAIPVVVGLIVVPVAVLAYRRLRVRMRDLQAARGRTEQALVEVEQSRRRLVAATESERRRIQHDLHEGAQQGLAALHTLLWETQRALPTGPTGTGSELDDVRGKLGAARAQLTDAIEELRDLVQGIYPAVLQDHGLLQALQEVARSSLVPVVLDVPARRWPQELEITAYFCVKEAITNALKHAQASRVEVTARDDGDAFTVTIEDDGLGQALPPEAGGLRMLQDRVETFGGRITAFSSTPGTGTSITLHLPSPPTTTTTVSTKEA